MVGVDGTFHDPVSDLGLVGVGGGSRAIEAHDSFCILKKDATEDVKTGVEARVCFDDCDCSKRSWRLP